MSTSWFVHRLVNYEIFRVLRTRFALYLHFVIDALSIVTIKKFESSCSYLNLETMCLNPLICVCVCVCVYVCVCVCVCFKIFDVVV